MGREGRREGGREGGREVKFRVRVRIRVRVVNMFGVMVMVRVNTTQNLKPDP